MIKLDREQYTGYIEQSVKGHNIRLHGKVLALYESDRTATFRADNGVTRSGIPMECIELDESVVDKVVGGLKKAASFLQSNFRKIGGLVRSVWKGKVIPCINSVMIGQYAARDMIPAAVGFIPSDETSEIARQMKAMIAARDAEPDPDEGKDINAFWRQVMDYIKNTTNEAERADMGMSDVKDAYFHVLSESAEGRRSAKFLKHNAAFNRFWGENTLNEGDTPANILSLFKENNIPDVGMSDIVRVIALQLKLAFKVGEFDIANNPETQASIAKTAQQQVADQLPQLQQSAAYMNADEKGKHDMVIKLYWSKYSDILAHSGGFGGDDVKSKQMIATEKPVMIWGAPGIGKTSIVRQVIGQFRKQYHKNTSIIDTVLSSMNADDFKLSMPDKDPYGQMRTYEAPISWLPVWHPSGDIEIDSLRNKNANSIVDSNVEDSNGNKINAQNIDNANGSDKVGKDGKVGIYTGDADEHNYQKFAASAGKNMSGDNAEAWLSDLTQMASSSDFIGGAEGGKAAQAHDGGILFFDEISRATKPVMNVIMNLINDRKLGEWNLGSHWIITAAGNRFFDMGGNVQSTWEPAYGTRFTQMNFVPTFEDWIKWAQGYNMDLEGNYSKENKSVPRIDADIIEYLISKNTDGLNNAWYENRSEKDNAGDENHKSLTQATPRSWQTASDTIWHNVMNLGNGDSYTDDFGSYKLDPDDKTKIMQKIVGTSAGNQWDMWKKQDQYFTPECMKNVWNTGNTAGVPTEILGDDAAVLKYMYSHKDVAYFLSGKTASKIQEIMETAGDENTFMTKVSKIKTKAGDMSISEQILLGMPISTNKEQGKLSLDNYATLLDCLLKKRSMPTEWLNITAQQYGNMLMYVMRIFLSRFPSVIEKVRTDFILGKALAPLCQAHAAKADGWNEGIDVDGYMYYTDSEGNNGKWEHKVYNCCTPEAYPYFMWMKMFDNAVTKKTTIEELNTLVSLNNQFTSKIGKFLNAFLLKQKSTKDADSYSKKSITAPDGSKQYLLSITRNGEPFDPKKAQKEAEKNAEV